MLDLNLMYWAFSLFSAAEQSVRGGEGRKGESVLLGKGEVKVILKDIIFLFQLIKDVILTYSVQPYFTKNPVPSLLLVPHRCCLLLWVPL